MTAVLASLLPGAGPPAPGSGPQVTSLVLLIPAAVLVLVGMWGWRNAESLVSDLPLDDRTREKRRQTYRRGAATCVVGAGGLVLLVILSFFSLGG